VLRFRPRYFQRHRGLKFFEPWTYALWSKPIVGWCSWFAFFDQVTEQDVKRTADVMSDVLRPFGYEYLQIDDGYQRGTGLPELWLKANAKFPAGLAALAAYIKGKGLEPGIWTNAAFTQTDFADAHRDWFVLDGSGAVARGNWIAHPVDASVAEALDALVRPIYHELRGMGWEYFKLDALRHLRYEGYNTFRGYFERKNVDPVDAFRRYVAVVREEIGRDRFLLACWGVRPELAGLVDGVRIGTDGFSYAGLAQYNSFNNIVWRNDPDHIELSDTEAWRSTMVTSLTGSVFLLTDKPSVPDCVRGAGEARARAVMRPPLWRRTRRGRLNSRAWTARSAAGPAPDAGLTAASISSCSKSIGRSNRGSCWADWRRPDDRFDELGSTRRGPISRSSSGESSSRARSAVCARSTAGAFNSQVFVIRGARTRSW
jgi:hypothetical protein